MSDDYGASSEFSIEYNFCFAEGLLFFTKLIRGTSSSSAPSPIGVDRGRFGVAFAGFGVSVLLGRCASSVNKAPADMAILDSASLALCICGVIGSSKVVEPTSFVGPAFENCSARAHVYR